MFSRISRNLSEIALVPMLINFHRVEIGAILTAIKEKKIKVRIGVSLLCNTGML